MQWLTSVLILIWGSDWILSISLFFDLCTSFIRRALGILQWLIPMMCHVHLTTAEPLSSFFNQRLVEEAHIVWAYNSVKIGYSGNSVGDFGNVLRRISPNDKVTEKFQMGRKNLVYVVNYGLLPYFKESVKNQILKSPFIAAWFKFQWTVQMQTWNFWEKLSNSE